MNGKQRRLVFPALAAALVGGWALSALLLGDGGAPTVPARGQATAALLPAAARGSERLSAPPALDAAASASSAPSAAAMVTPDVTAPPALSAAPARREVAPGALDLVEAARRLERARQRVVLPASPEQHYAQARAQERREAIFAARRAGASPVERVR